MVQFSSTGTWENLSHLLLGEILLIFPPFLFLTNYIFIFLYKTSVCGNLFTQQIEKMQPLVIFEHSVKYYIWGFAFKLHTSNKAVLWTAPFSICITKQLHRDDYFSEYPCLTPCSRLSPLRSFSNSLMTLLSAQASSPLLFAVGFHNPASLTGPLGYIFLFTKYISSGQNTCDHSS